MLDPIKKDTPSPRAKEKLQQDGKRGEITIRNKHVNCLRCSEGSNLVCTSTPRLHWDWARTVFECLLQRYSSAVSCCRGRGSGCSRPGYGISPLGGSRINPTIEPLELMQNWGNRLLEGTNRTVCVLGQKKDPAERNNLPYSSFHINLSHVYSSNEKTWLCWQAWSVALQITGFLMLHDQDCVKIYYNHV